MLILLFCFVLSSCISVDTGIVKGTGTIVYLNFEGGFYGIIADNGEHYDPINLPSEFKKDGLRVRFKRASYIYKMLCIYVILQENFETWLLSINENLCK